MRCPAPEKLLTYLEAGPDAVSSSQAQHIASCAACAARLQELRNTAGILQSISCPSAEELVDLAAGALTGEAYRHVAEHVAACPSCKPLLEEAQRLLSSPAEAAQPEDIESISKARQRFRERIGHKDLIAEILDVVKRLRDRLEDIYAHPGPARWAPIPTLSAQQSPSVSWICPSPPPALAYARARRLSPTHRRREPEPPPELMSLVAQVGEVLSSCQQRRLEVLEVARETLALWESYVQGLPEAQRGREMPSVVDRLQSALRRLEERLP